MPNAHTAMSSSDRSAGIGRPPPLGALDLEAHLRDPRARQAFVTPMFDTIAPRYDRFTRLFSFGMDARWKRDVVAWATAPPYPGPRVLDLACGTGDLAFGVVAAREDAQVLALDASPRMVEQAQARRSRERAADRVRIGAGDMMALPFADASFDIATVGYGFRNVPEWTRALDEVARVLRPGGRLVSLDFFRPERAVWRTLFLAWLSAAGNAVGWAWHRDPVVYGYISRSIDHFVSWETFARALQQRGFQVDRVAPRLMGGVAIHVATRVARG